MTVDNATQARLLCALAGDPVFFTENVPNLHLSDFPSLPVRIVFETIRAHWRLYGTLPGPTILPDEVLDAMRGVGPDGKESISTVVPKALIRNVASVLGQAISAMSHPDQSNSEYFRDRWQEYLSEVRVGQLNAETSAREQLRKAAALNEEIEKISGSRQSEAVTAGKRILRSRSEPRGQRHGTGVWPIDLRMKMGMQLGELGVVMATTGLGKSNMLINFAVNAALTGKRVLFMSLEVDYETILKRLQAMIGVFPISLMDEYEEEWAEKHPKELERYNYLTKQGFPYIDYITVNTEYTTRSATCADIEREIKAWKRKMHADGVSDDDCPLVCIDYIHQMSFAGVATKNDNLNTQYGNIARRLHQLAVDTKCIVWTAQQAARGCEKKQHLSVSDIADSIDIARHSEVVLGMTLVGIDPRTGQDTNQWGSDSQVTEESEDDAPDKFGDKERLVNIDFCKLRNSGEKGTFCTVFQSKSLRFYTSARYADLTESRVNEMPLESFYLSVRPKTVNQET